MQKLIIKLTGSLINLLSLVSPTKAGQKAFELFCKPPKVNIRPKEQQFMDTAQTVRLMVNDLQYTQFTWGKTDAPYVLLAYGWAYNTGRWRHFVPTLVDAGYQVIAFDPPGHGLTPGNHLNLLLNTRIISDIIHRNGKPASMIAHSFGGSSSILALSDLPKSIHPDRFVLMASFSASVPIFEDFAKQVGLNTRVLNYTVSHAEELLGSTLEFIDMAQIVKNLGNIHAMIVHDPLDEVTPFLHAERYHANWPHSTLYKANGGGHHLGLPTITEAILEFALRGQEVPYEKE